MSLQQVRTVNNLMIRFLNLCCVFFLAAVTAGCATMAQPPETLVNEQPPSKPQATVTSLHQAVVCMDDLFLEKKVPTALVSSEGIYNYAISNKSISSGGKEILIVTLSQLAERSNSVRFVAYGTDMKDMLDLQGVHPRKKTFQVPNIFIRGGLIQMYDSWRGQKGAGISAQLTHNQDTADGLLSYSDTGKITQLSLDFSAGDIATLQVIPGLTSSVTMSQIVDRDRSVNADISLDGLGLTASLDNELKSDPNDMYRALIQLGAIELMGKVHKVPYWTCVSKAIGSEESKEERLTHFVQLNSSDKLQSFSQDRLIELKYLKEEDKSDSQAFQSAIADFQQRYKLIPTGLIDFPTFNLLMM